MPMLQKMIRTVLTLTIIGLIPTTAIAENPPTHDGAGAWRDGFERTRERRTPPPPPPSPFEFLRAQEFIDQLALTDEQYDELVDLEETLRRQTDLLISQVEESRRSLSKARRNRDDEEEVKRLQKKTRQLHESLRNIHELAKDGLAEILDENQLQTLEDFRPPRHRR
jgi:Spy/CpxP family protein refolding chaperone